MSQSDTLKSLHSQHLQTQLQQQTQALELIGLVQQLNVNDNIIEIFGHNLSNLSASQVIRLHNRNDLSLENSIAVLQALVAKDSKALQVDIAQLAVSGASIEDCLAKVTPTDANKAVDVVLYGFGRIGRILTRLLMANTATDKGLQLKAIVVRPAGASDLFKRATLLNHDTAHGNFDADIQIDEENNSLIINGRFVQVIYANNPSEIDYTSYGIDNALVIDNTGIWTDEEKLGQHLKAKGVQKVLLTAPAKGDIKNIVYGCNEDTIADDKIVSAASCTTNAIAPTLNVIHDKFGITTGHVETVHSYTNDQNLIDNYHKKDRRGRSAPLNMVITTTGAAKAVGKVLTELNGKLTGNAIRVPTANVSMAILNLNLATAPADKDELNAYLEQATKSLQWQHQIGVTNSTEAVSSDFMGSQTVGVIDMQATIVTDNHATVYIWYDNEVGYSTQVLRVAKNMVGVKYQDLLA